MQINPLLLSLEVSHDVTRNEYFVFSSLVPLLHLRGVTGAKARDALLLILSLSDRDTEVANYLTSKSDICPVNCKLDFHVLGLVFQSNMG